MCDRLAIFWDPLQTNFQSQQLNTSVSDNRSTTNMQSELRVSDLTYDEYRKVFNSSVGLNHSKGENVYDNFGYIKVNDKWADPDSVGSLHRAQQNDMDASPEATSNNRTILPRTTIGPRIMSPEEYSAFWAEDDLDFSGVEDAPGNEVIDPATFARWAAGATKGDKYVEELLDIVVHLILPRMLASEPTHKPQIFEPRTRALPGRIAITPTTPPPQWYVDNGELCSGHYTDNSNPSVQESPRGRYYPVVQISSLLLSLYTI